MKRTVFRVIVSGLMMLCLPTISQATAYACTGTISRVVVDAGGQVNVSFDFQSPTVGSMAFETMCNVTQVVNNIQTDTCKSMLAVMLSAKLTQSTMVVWFDNSTPNVCTMQAWSNLKDFGWYWGPALQ